MSLPWGKSEAAGTPAGAGTVDVRIVPFEEPSSSRSFFSAFRTPRRFATDASGVTTATPSAPYQIEVSIRDADRPRDGGALLVVRASIGGVEINEQLIVRAGDGRQTVKFIGWLDSPDGTKRIKFTFPASGETQIQVGVFEGTSAGSGKDKQRDGGFAAPPVASGQGFEGPPVSMESVRLGQPVAIGVARLRPSSN